MMLHVRDEVVSSDLIDRRKRLGQDRKDEVWDGVYVIMPDPTINHQRMVFELATIFNSVVRGLGLGEV